MNLPPGVEVYQGIEPGGGVLSGRHTRGVRRSSLDGLKQVYVRDLSQLDAVAIRGSENAPSCFFSPAGDAVGFITDRGVNKVSLRDHAVTFLAPYARTGIGGTWGSDGRVTFARDDGLWQVPTAGGTPTQITSLTAGESVHAWPAAVNDGTDDPVHVRADAAASNARALRRSRSIPARGRC